MRAKILAACAAVAMAATAAAAPPDRALEPAVMAPLAAQSLLLDLAWAGEAIVAVGERGHVLRSTDQGRSWTQMPVPASAGLTAVFFLDAQHGWAVGHDELILRTDDGGQSWERTHFEPANQRPLLDVWFADAQNGFAVGAYGTIYRSGDGGRTWQLQPFEPKPPVGGRVVRQQADDEMTAAMTQEVDLGSEFHLNAIVRGPGGELYLAAEAGRVYRSDDAGATWQELAPPYDGSFYGVLPLDGTSLLVFGLRGNLFRSDDGGRTWAALPSGTTQLLTAGARDGQRVVLSGLAGVILVSEDGGRTFRFTQQDDRKGFSAVLLAGGELVLAGEAGVRRLAIPTPR